MSLLEPQQRINAAASGSLGDRDDDGRFRHARQGDPFLHQREAAAGCGRHGSQTGIGCAQGHADGGDLVLGLLEMHGQLWSGGGEVVHDRRGRRHGVDGHELAAAQDRTEGQGLVSVELAVTCRLCRNRKFSGDVPPKGKIETLLQNLLPPGFGSLRDFLRSHADNGKNDADQDCIAGRYILEIFPGLLLDFLRQLPGEPDAPLTEVRLVPPLRFPVQGDDHIPRPPAQGMDGMIGDADHVKVVTAADPGHVVLGGKK